ncbi:helicase protein, partial [Cooperia oncophora]
LFRESSQRLAILISRLARSKFKVEQLTGDLYGNRRIKVLRRFKTGTTRVLICSDVLSRGVDVEGIDCVVNYELPKNDRLFVHRAGRTGRAGRLGHVLSLGDGEERKIFVKNVLRKNGLWVNAEEEVVERNVYENHLGRYEKALAHLKKELVATNAIAKDKKPKVSGFAYRKKSSCTLRGNTMRRIASFTRYRYGSVYKWPLNWILPAMKRREILTKLQDNGWADKVSSC